MRSTPIATAAAAAAAADDDDDSGRDDAAVPVAAAGPSRLQYAALPFRLLGDRTIEVMVLTSRESRRWIVPKGWPKKGRPGHAVAAREALEEAGVVGRIGKREIGSYRYVKLLADGGGVNCIVRVYPLDVKGQLDDWPEKGERESRWLDPAEAAALVTEPGLRKLLLRAAKSLRRFGRRRR